MEQPFRQILAMICPTPNLLAAGIRSSLPHVLSVPLTTTDGMDSTMGAGQVEYEKVQAAEQVA